MNINKKNRIITVLMIVTALGMIVIGNRFLSDFVNTLTLYSFSFIQGLDKDNAFLSLFLHHIIQAVFYIILIVIAIKVTSLNARDFGFQIKNMGKAIRYAIIFMLTINAIILIVNMIVASKFGGEIFAFSFPMTTKNIAGYVLFQGLLSGTSEELFFRGFLVTILMWIFKNRFEKQKKLRVVAMIMTALIFAIAHIGFTIIPFGIAYFQPTQVLIAFFYGIFYCYLFFKTQNIYGVMIAHNLSNVFSVLFSLLVYNIWA